jgi:hypothetical protein
MDESQLEAREKLKEFASQLKRLSFPSSPISIELAKFVEVALENYLDKKAKSLDAAFGLNPKRGTKGYRRDFNRKRAEQIMRLRLDGKSWMDIANNLGGKDGIPKDEREIRRIADEFMIEIMAEEISPDDLFDD